jgi:DNA-binding LytR/AlgR family response regulator
LIVNKAGKRFPIDYTLDLLETMVDPESFFRINRKVLIDINAIDKVTSYFNGRLKINNTLLEGEAGIVSRERVNDFKLWLDR